MVEPIDEEELLEETEDESELNQKKIKNMGNQFNFKNWCD